MLPKNQILEDQPDMHGNCQPGDLPKDLKNETHELNTCECKCLHQELLQHPKSEIHDVKLNAHSRFKQKQESISRKQCSITIKSTITECIVLLSSVQWLICAFIVTLWSFKKKHLAYVASMTKSIWHYWLSN